MSARILVVDDILPNVKLLEAKLKQEYYQVITATSGEAALALAEEQHPDLILLDVMMPEMDGYEVCRRLKSNPDLSHIPVVMVTALSDADDKVRGLEVGADDFLTKPINDIALLARVRSLVRLKMTMDEWRVRESAAYQLGVDGTASVMDQGQYNGRVLVVEDQELYANKIKDFLTDEHDFIEIVPSGPLAIESVAQRDYDVLVISLNLASEDGLRLLSYFKSSERTRHTPVVLVGQNEDLMRISHGLEFGAHDYIVRPLEKNELKARIQTQIRKKRFQDRLRESYDISLTMAITDSLTGLYNRRYMESHLDRILKKNDEDHKEICVLVMDIDFFKKVNDTYGHGVGDEVLKVFADRLKNKLRSIDTLARYGGEEFVVILPDTSQERAMRVAERLRTTIADDAFRCSAPEGSLKITASIGGVIIGADSEDKVVAAVIDRADKCLYQAKDAGRNCVVFDKIGRLKADKIANDTAGSSATDDCESGLL